MLITISEYVCWFFTTYGCICILALYYKCYIWISMLVVDYKWVCMLVVHYKWVRGLFTISEYVGWLFTIKEYVGCLIWRSVYVGSLQQIKPLVLELAEQHWKPRDVDVEGPLDYCRFCFQITMFYQSSVYIIFFQITVGFVFKSLCFTRVVYILFFFRLL